MLTLAMPQIGALRGPEEFGFLLVTGEDARRQALRYVVAQGDGLLDRVVGQHVKNGGEGLFPDDVGLLVDADDGRLGVSGPGRGVGQAPVAAHEDLPALCLHPGKGVLHGVGRRAGDEWSDEGALVERVADGQLLVHRGQPREPGFGADSALLRTAMHCKGRIPRN